jgi:hypothetical protein
MTGMTQASERERNATLRRLAELEEELRAAQEERMAMESYVASMKAGMLGVQR